MQLILLPGMDGTGDLFDDFVAALARRNAGIRVTVVRYPPDSCWGYAELTAYAAQFIPTDEPSILLGESFSGPIAITLAQRFSKQVRAVIFAASFARNPLPSLSPFSGLTRFLPLQFAPPFARSMMLANQGQHTKLEAALVGVSVATLRARMQAVLQVDVSAQLRELDVPLLYLQAKRDRLVPPSSAQWMLQCQPGMMMYELDAPHLVLQGASDECARVVAGFCDRDAKS